MERAMRALMGNNLPPRFKFKDTYDSIEVPTAYQQHLPSQATLEAKFDELIAEEEVVAPTTQIKADMIVSSNLEVGTSNLFVDTETGNVGIGTNSPGYKLDVNGTVNTGALIATTGNFSGDIHVHQSDTGVATLSAYGDSQGTGRLYVGQSSTYGGGIEYNGDNSPTSTGAGADYITLYRVNNGGYDWTARNKYNSNDWEFRGTVTAPTFSGNAATATALETARNINGVSFNGSANITVNGLNYDVNDGWLKEQGDNAHFRQYGNTRQMVFRTDGTTEYASGVGGYPFVWMYGGDEASNRRMLLNSSGQLWCSNYGWLHDKFVSRNSATAQTFTDNNSNATFTGHTIDFNGSGTETNTANRTHRAFFIDYDTSASGGTATNNVRNYHYAMHSDMRHGGTSQPYAFYNQLLYTRSDHTSGTCSNMRGVDNTVVSSGTGLNTAIWGINTYVLKDGGSTGATSTIYGNKTEVEVDAGTVTNAYAYHAHIDRDAGTLTTGYLYYGSYSGTVGTKWGVYITGESKNYFSGNVGIGTVSPSDKLHVNGGNLRISAAAAGGVYDNGYQWLECDNDTAWYRLTKTPKTDGIACYNGIAINENGGLVVGSWDSPNALGVGNGKFTGDLTVDGKIYNYNYTEVDINNPATVSGSWATANTSSWGDPKFNHTYDRYRWNDAPGYVEYTIPAGMKSAYLSQLQWSSGGYVDVHGVQSDGGFVFLRRINTRQRVENTNEGNPDQHDGSTITFAGSGLQYFSKIRLTNKMGRFHMTGLAFTPNENEGTEGTGMVHTAQISDLSGHPVQYVADNVHSIVSYGATSGGRYVTPLDVTITPKFSNSKIFVQWVINFEAHQDMVFRVYRGSTLIGYNTSIIGNRWNGVATPNYDRNESSTPEQSTISWIDSPNTTSAVTYRVYVQSSSTGSYPFYLNRTYGSSNTGQDAYERMVSYKSAMEIAV